jgi:ABC-2 type transport system ATP-binding protein
MQTQNNIIIQTHGLTKAYKGTNVLQNLDLQVPHNSICGFLGPNGAGKSTTIKLLLGLTRPSAGRAEVFGTDSVRDSVAIRQRVGYLAQDPRYYDHMTARETLRFTAHFCFSGPSQMIEKRIEETLELVGITDKADRPIKNFSGGERQRLGIAQAQINYPDLIILDEPAASLDPMGRRDVLEVMERLRKHTTIFYSTHILDDVQRVSDTVVIMNHGQLVAHAPIEELMAGTDGIVYSLIVKGDSQSVRARLSQQAWVTSVKTTSSNGSTALQVKVADADLAEAQLLRLALSDTNVTVSEFGRKKHNLEEVFLGLVEEDKVPISIKEKP